MPSAGDYAMTSPSRRHGSVAPTPQQPITKPARHHARSRSPGSPSCAQRTLGGNLASAVTVHGARIGSGSVAAGGMCRRSGHCSRASSGSGSSSRLGCAAAVRLRVPSTVPPKASSSSQLWVQSWRESATWRCAVACAWVHIAASSIVQAVAPRPGLRHSFSISDD